MPLYAGIDLHSNNCMVVIQDEQDNVVGRRRIANDLGSVSAWLEPHRERLAGVVVESTYNWYWLVDGLMERGYRVHLANTTAIEQYDGLKYRDDASDGCMRYGQVVKRVRLGREPGKVWRGLRAGSQKSCSTVVAMATRVSSLDTAGYRRFSGALMRQGLEMGSSRIRPRP
jgi:hypothetical protein